MSLSPLSDWRHGSKAPPRTLSPDAKRSRLEELRASHVRVALRRAIHAGALKADEFYRAIFDDWRERDMQIGVLPSGQVVASTARPAAFHGRFHLKEKR